MGRTIPEWPDYATIDVPPKWLSGDQRLLMAVTVVDGRELPIVIPYSQELTEWPGLGREVKGLIETAVADLSEAP